MKWTHKELAGLAFATEKVIRHPTVDGLRLRIYPTGRKAWQWARMLQGKPLRKTLGKFPSVSLAEAQALAGELNASFDRGVDPTIPPAQVAIERPRVTVTEAWDRYIEDCRRRGNKPGATVKHDLAGRKDIVSLLGGKFLSDVTVDEVRVVASAPLKRSSLNPTAVTGGAVRSNTILSMTRTFFKFCLDSGYDDLTRNPCASVRPIKTITGRKPKRVLTIREMALLILAARELDKRNRGKTTWADALSLLVLNGNRKSEAFEAMGDEWDPVSGLWRIGGARYKTGVDCILPVGPTSASIFRRRARPGEFLIPSQSGIRTGQDRHICDRLTDIMIEIGGEPISRWSMHAIRYGFRSNIRKEGIADSELAERIIHPGRDGEMAVHYDPDWLDEMRVALAAWDKRIAAEVTAVCSSNIVSVA